MAVHVDHLQSLIDRGDVYDPDSLPSVPAGVVVALPRRRRTRSVGFDAVRILAALAVVAWAIVAVETWMLVQ